MNVLEWKRLGAPVLDAKLWGPAYRTAGVALMTKPRGPAVTGMMGETERRWSSDRTAWTARTPRTTAARRRK